MKRMPRGIVRQRILALAALAGAILFFAYDLVADWLYEEDYGAFHFIVELAVFVGVSMALILGLRDLQRLRAQLKREERRNRLLSGALAKSIDERLDEWRMTPSEKDVAWLIVKGYRFSEIARIRGVKEGTVRLQATSLYTKAEVSGRAEFVAEILQPLLMTIPDDAARRAEMTGGGTRPR